MERLKDIALPLLVWYDGNRRILPWREEPTPYHVWVSEIMLQQTRVEAVKPYYKRFMEAFPDIETLAIAPEQQLLKMWEGLGYYSRVRNMQKAAVQIMEEYGGQMPGDYEQLLKLKGIGSYTAGAISSIAFKRPYPAVDGNVLRVLSRVRMDGESISEEKVKKRVFTELLEAIPKDRPGDYNQALMDLGAGVCLPNGAPLCEACPLKHICLACQSGCQTDYPKKASKKARTIEEKTVLIIQDENRAALRKRPDKGLLAGLYEFPSMEGYHTAEEVVEYLKENGLNTLRIQRIGDAKHIFSHREWHMMGYQVRVDELSPKGKGAFTEDFIYLEPEQTQEEYPIPSAFAAYVPYLNIKLTGEKYRE